MRKKSLEITAFCIKLNIRVFYFLMLKKPVKNYDRQDNEFNVLDAFVMLYNS